MPKLPTAEQVMGKSAYRKPIKTIKVPLVNLVRIQVLVNDRIDMIEQILQSEVMTPRMRSRLERKLAALHADLKAICGGK